MTYDHDSNSTPVTTQECVEMIADSLNVCEINDVRTFEDCGLLTNNDGLVIRTIDGYEYQITVVQSRRPIRYFVTELQACEVDDLPRSTPEGVRVTVHPELWNGFPEVDVEGPNAESVIEFVRLHWGDDDSEWFTEYVVNRVQEVS